MFSFIITLAFLWLIARYVPHGDKIVAVVIAVILLRWLGLLPFIVAL